MNAHEGLKGLVKQDCEISGNIEETMILSKHNEVVTFPADHTHSLMETSYFKAELLNA